MRLLIVGERDELLQELTRRLSSRHDVLTAGSGTGGLALLSAARPDVVLLDISVPDIIGLEYLRLCSRVVFFAARSRKLFGRDPVLMRQLELALSEPDVEAPSVEEPQGPATLIGKARALLSATRA